MNLNENLVSRAERTDTSTLHRIYNKIDWLIQFFGSELGNKQHLIQQQQHEINLLKNTIRQKDMTVAQLEKKLKECSQAEEGNRQLINKLLADISRYQNDIEWFKRTYEQRSVLGLFKQKFFK